MAAPKKRKTLDEQLADAEAAVVLLENEQDIQTILDWQKQQAIKDKRFTTDLQAAFITAGHCFPDRHVPYVNWLRAVDRYVNDDFKVAAKAVILERFALSPKATQEQKDDWLRELNIQIKAYLSSNVELVWKKKS